MHRKNLLHGPQPKIKILTFSFYFFYSAGAEKKESQNIEKGSDCNGGTTC